LNPKVHTQPFLRQKFHTQLGCQGYGYPHLKMSEMQREKKCPAGLWILKIHSHVQRQYYLPSRLVIVISFREMDSSWTTVSDGSTMERKAGCLGSGMVMLSLVSIDTTSFTWADQKPSPGHTSGQCECIYVPYARDMHFGMMDQ